jgi:hypothetical protein
VSITLVRYFWKRFGKSNQGSVSVYLIVILVPIFLFHAVLIDFARVKLAERESEMAVKTAIRSVLSGFDLNLQPYGLFGLNVEADQANVLFEDIIKQNITPVHPGNYVHLLDEQLNEQSFSIKSIYTLANQTVFHQQIVEEMKYKAPLEYTLELVNKFKKTTVTTQLKASEQFSVNAVELERLLEERNQALDNSWSHTILFLDHAESLATQSLDNMKSSIASNYSDLSDKYNTIINDLNDAEVKNTLLNNEKKRLITASDASLASDEVFHTILIYDINYFSKYRTELSKIVANISGLKTKLDRKDAESTAFVDLWKQDMNGLSSQIRSFRQEQRALEAQRQQNSNQSKLKRNEQKSKLEQAVSAAKNSNQGCNLLNEDPYIRSYQRLNGEANNSREGLYHKYRNYNSNSDEFKSNEQIFTLDSGEAATESTKNWVNQFSGALTDFRDELYLNEYALNKFSYRTIKGNSLISKHNLKNQEVEYILYGLNSCSANYSAAYGEMYVMLLAIRTMEALLKPQNELLNIGSPMLVFLAAAAEGAVNAYSDMSKLLIGEAIPILKKTPNQTVDYKQLLRIFLLIHHHEERMMSRMQALIELETGALLEKKSTYIQGSAIISLRLWFIPDLLRSLKIGGISKCKLTDNRCEIKKTAVMSY